MLPVQLAPRFVERIWGSLSLEPWFASRPERIGEVWLSSDDNQTSLGVTLRKLMEERGTDLLGTEVQPAFGGRFPILVKFLFPQERLSVQVHPDDAQGEARENSPGKTEMWHVVDAKPGAELAAGFSRPVSSEEFRRSLGDGAVEGLLHWWPAAAGETYFIPARTVHAVGAGLVICEVQQNSDITYRLWDYGRPRELHIEESVAVADLGPHAGPTAAIPISDGGEQLVQCPYFITSRYRHPFPAVFPADTERFAMLIVLRGEGELRVDDTCLPLRAGQGWLIPASCPEQAVTGPSLEILRVQPGRLR